MKERDTEVTKINAIGDYNYINMIFLLTESLLIAPSTGICLKRVNYLGQQSSRFFQMTQIKTIVIMEGFTKVLLFFVELEDSS